MSHKVKCPVCHNKIIPLPMMREDTMALNSKDGYLLRGGKSGANKGITQETRYNYGYVIREY